MSIIDDYLPFVKEQISVQEKMVSKFADQTWRQNLHLASLAKFKALEDDIKKTADYIKELEKRPEIKPIADPQLNLSFEEIQGLPDELLKELSISETDKTEFTIKEIILAAGGIASLDRILVELYKKTNEVCKRTTMTSRLYRMAQKGMVFNVGNKKGIYSVFEVVDPKQLATLFDKSEEVA